MRKLYIKIIAFICIVGCVFTSVEPLSVKSMSINSEYEENYVFKKEDSNICIPQKVLRVPDYENYYFKDDIDLDYDNGKTNTYMLYEKASDEPYCIGNLDGNIVLFNNDIYLIKNGICIVNQFYYIGKGDDDCEYWVYFGNDGKLAKDTIINGVFKLDKNGLFDYRQSDLYKRTLKSVKNYIPKINDVTDILNKKKTSNLGKWVKIEDYAAHKPPFTTNGHFVNGENGQLRYWADSVFKNTALIPSSSILNIQKYEEGYQFLPDDNYDWKTILIAENEYLSDILIEMDGHNYYFNDKGYAVKNKWVWLDYEYNYFDGTGKLVTNDWVAKDGELYRLDGYGSIMKSCWVKEGDRNTYLSFDGTIYYALKNKEYDIFKNILEFRKKYPENAEVGICGIFANMLVEHLFGKKAKGTKYAYDWDKIKVGDTIYGDNHIFVVMAKDRDCITAAESNDGWDLLAHYGRIPLSKVDLDELSKKGKMRYTFTTYYSSPAKSITDFKPQQVKLSAKSSNNMVTIMLDKSQGAVGYCIYMSNSKDGDYKLIKTIKAEDELKYTTNKLSAGDYYYKARAYRIINNNKVWSEYSSIAKCNILR